MQLLRYVHGIYNYRENSDISPDMFGTGSCGGVDA